MLGPLPPLYRAIVGGVALVVGIGGGAWAALVLPSVVLTVETLVSAGASIGLAVGLLCAYALLHPPHEHSRVQHRQRRRP